MWTLNSDWDESASVCFNPQSFWIVVWTGYYWTYQPCFMFNFVWESVKWWRLSAINVRIRLDKIKLHKTICLVLCYCLYSYHHSNTSFIQDWQMLFDPSKMYKYSPRSLVTDIPLTERQSLRDDHKSTFLRFFNLPLWIGSNDRWLPFYEVIKTAIFIGYPICDGIAMCNWRNGGNQCALVSHQFIVWTND